MSSRNDMRAPAWFWLVCGLALLWEAAGVAAYLGQVYGDGAALGEAQLSLIRSTPAWVTGAYATAVFAGLAGAVSLLLKRRWAASLFVLSLAAAVIQFGWVFTAGRAAELLGPSAAILPATIILVGAALVWFARRADRNGWLR